VQLISANAPNERERITKISGQIRALAKDSGVPIVAISQLNRPKDRNQNERPNKFSYVRCARGHERRRRGWID
jgi:replicative DNA helicase